MTPAASSHVPLRPSRVVARLLAATAFLALLAVAAPAFGKPLVVIDPGHGGIYNNARYGTFLEKQANLLIALELGRQLYASGYDVQFTRTTDTAVTYADINTWHWIAAENRWLYAADGVARYSDGVPRDDLQARCDVANNLGADLFISVHCNGSNSSAAAGTENWASTHDMLGQQLGHYVQGAVLEQTGQRNRGAGQTDFYVVRWTNMPALLLETGFMSNPTEGAWIANTAWRQKYARGVVNGINRWWVTNPVAPVHPRYTGARRSDGAVAASRAQWPGGAGTVLLASTLDAPSAYAAPLATASLNAPLLLADMKELTPATLAELTRLKPTRILAFGAELPDALLEQAAAAAGIDPAAVERVSGSEPVAASAVLSAVLISEETSIPVVIADGSKPTEAIAGATLAAAKNAALLLTRADGTLPAEAAAFLSARSANITGVYTMGSRIDAFYAFLPNRTRVGGSESDQILGAAALSARAQGGLWLHAYNPLVPADTLMAACAAANRAGGVPVPVSGRYLSPYTREWLENQGHRVFAATMVGNLSELPAAADHYLRKAIY